MANRFVDIQCSNCGRIDRVAYTMEAITHSIKKGGIVLVMLYIALIVQRLGAREIRTKN